MREGDGYYSFVKVLIDNSCIRELMMEKGGHFLSKKDIGRMSNLKVETVIRYFRIFKKKILEAHLDEYVQLRERE
jgi:hypothetical protein